jgi:hypothetical protein
MLSAHLRGLLTEEQKPGREQNKGRGWLRMWGFQPLGSQVFCAKVPATAVFLPQGNVGPMWPELIIFLNEIRKLARCQRLTPVILSTPEVEIRRIPV